MGGSIERVATAEALRWIKSFRPDEPEQRGVHRVGELLPAGLERYLRVFHPWRRNPDAGPPLDNRTWESFADEAGVVFHAELQATSLAAVNAVRNGARPYWTDEGYLDSEIRERLLIALAGDAATPALFLFASAAVSSGGETMVYRGPPPEVQAICAAATGAVPLPIGGRQLPAEKIWAEDRSWVVATDFDLHSTYVGASEEAVRRIESDPDLETLPVTRSTRIDWYSDLVNGTGCVERPLN